jgi:uncharacterized repeat protein (TIGR03943 family)
VLDYATRAIWDKRRTMVGRRIRLTGFLTPRPAGGYYLTRIMLSCCAADGRPIKVGFSGAVPAGLKADAWVEVVGAYDPRTERDRANGGVIPYLKVQSLRGVRQPTEPYEQ